MGDTSSASYDSATTLLRDCLIAPLRAMSPDQIPRGYYVVLVDGLCEAECHRTDSGETLASFLTQHFRELPPWLRIVCTVRSCNLDIVKDFPYQRIR